MKKLLKTGLYCLMAIVCVIFCAPAFGIDAHVVTSHLGEGVKYTLASAPIVASMGSITEAQLAELKVKYGHIKLLTVIVEPEVKDKEGNIITPEESYHFVARRPDRGHIKMLMPLAQKQEIEEFAEKAVKNLIVGGDMDALEDGIVYMGVVQELKGLMTPAQSFLANA